MWWEQLKMVWNCKEKSSINFWKIYLFSNFYLWKSSLLFKLDNVCICINSEKKLCSVIRTYIGISKQGIVSLITPLNHNKNETKQKHKNVQLAFHYKETLHLSEKNIGVWRNLCLWEDEIDALFFIPPAKYNENPR